MSFFRSQQIDHYKLIIPRENAWQIMNLLGNIILNRMYIYIGQLNMIHIVGNNTPILSKPFTSQIRRCEQSLQKIFNLQQILIKRHLYSPRSQFTKYFFHLLSQYLYRQQLSHIFSHMFNIKYHQFQKQKSMSILDQIDDQVDMFWNNYQSLKKRKDLLENKLLFYRENIAIIKAGEKWFGVKSFNKPIQNNDIINIYDSQLLGLSSNSHKLQQKLTIKCGIIPNSQQTRFSRTIFRITKGNCYIKYYKLSQLYQKTTQSQLQKSIYFILVPAKQNSYFQRKLTKFINTSNSFNSQQPYRLPNSNTEYIKILTELSNQFNQTDHLLSLVEKQMGLFYHKILGIEETEDLLEVVSRNAKGMFQFRKVELIKIYLLKQLEIFTQLNQMELFNNFLQAEIYLKHDNVTQLQKKLTQFQKQTRQPSGHLIPIQKSQQINKKIPTLFQTNPYTISAQLIVQTYGVARYREANPSLFTTITFPFLFGVMFGDIAHGLILFTFGLFLIFFKGYISRNLQLLKIILPHRYLVALMGFFAVYCGFIYNDFLAINLNLFGSCYNLNAAEEGQVIEMINNQCVYPLGIDPVWGVAENNLNYLNSLKMKISVIIGVVHMTLGIIIKALNSLYFKRRIQFYFQFIPQLIFLLLVFGYMDFLIIYKWLTNWGYNNPHAPSIITTMINLPLQLGITDKQCCHGGQPMWGSTTDTTQDQIQLFILIVAVLCIPVMLLVKPIYEIVKIRKKNKKGSVLNNRQNSLEQHFQQQMVYLRQKIFDDNQNDANKQKQIQMAVLSYMNVQKQSDKNSDDQADDEQNNNHDDEHDPSEIFVHQIIQTIEFVLGCISNTASYLRLWALSLAHSQLAEVFFNKTIQSPIQSGYSGILGMITFFPVFASATFGVLMCMDVMECFLHTLRLHWVEFQNKFYKGDGEKFKAYNFVQKINQDLAVERYEQNEKGK